MPDARASHLGEQKADQPCEVLNADRALLLSLDAWGFPDLASSHPGARRWLNSQWAKDLDDAGRQHDPESSEVALQLLRSSHRFQCQADAAHVHPSWWSRALLDESPAVRRFVELHGANSDGSYPPEEPDRVPGGFERYNSDPSLTAWVLSLAGERLVGGEPVRWDEPPAIISLAALSPRELHRLAYATGQAKSALAENPQITLTGRTFERERNDWFHAFFGDRLGTSAAQARKWAERDLQSSPETVGLRRRRRLATLGLTSIARLLTGCEAYRVRWALQHLPYPVAKRLRSIMARSPARSASVLRLEDLVLEAAWSRLVLEGRNPLRQTDEIMGPGHGC